MNAPRRRPRPARRAAASPIPVEVVLQNPSRYPEGRAATLRPWLEALVSELAPGAALGVRLAGDRFVRTLNREFRGKDQPTDVLSFPGCPTPDGRLLGDVVISVPTARRQARAAAHPPARELRLLLLHGVLHCLGYDHDSDGGEMARLERRLRRSWIDHA